MQCNSGVESVVMGRTLVLLVCLRVVRLSLLYSPCVGNNTFMNNMHTIPLDSIDKAMGRQGRQKKKRENEGH